MKTLRLLAALALSSPAWAGYSYFFTDSLTSLNASNWTQAGSVVVSNGLSAPDPAGGSLIYRPTVPDGISPYDYEVRATIALANSGGSYTLFVRATSDARTGGGGSGTYYAFEMQNPTFDQSHTTCVANFVVYKRAGGSTSVLTSYQHACRDGMVLRLMVRPGYIMAYPDQSYIGSTPIGTDVITGQPGIGAYATAAGNSIRTVQIGLLDRIAPNAIEANSIGVSAFPYRVEMQWKGATDDSSGTGVMEYVLWRDGGWFSNQLTPEFVDATVTPGASHTYSIMSMDFHRNLSAMTTITVVSPPAGAVEPRRIGVRPTGSYWGASGENIDLQSGNLNFSVPLIQAKSRGNWSATFALNYNSQLWRQDMGGTWKLGRDVGYGFGWKLLAGSITPYWTGLWNLDHYVFTDSTGAEYRLDQNSGNVWTAIDGFYGSFDANTNRLYFPDGSFWMMGVQSSGNEQDAGTMYPSIMQDTNGNLLS